MESLFRWGIENSNSEKLKEILADGNKEALIANLRENREFLEHILKSDTSKMKEAISVLQDPKNAMEDRVNALDELEFLTQSLDNAQDLVKIGGLPTMMGLIMKREEHDVQVRAIWVVATCLQNNPFFLEAFIKEQGMEKLLDEIKTNQSVAVREKLAYALCGTLQNSQSSIKIFLDLNGLDVFLQLLKIEDDLATKRKLVFKMNQMVKEDANLAKKIGEKSFVQILVDILYRYKDQDLKLKVLETLVTLIETDPSNRSQAREAATLIKIEEAKKEGLDQEGDWNEDQEMIRSLFDKIVTLIEVESK